MFSDCWRKEVPTRPLCRAGAFFWNGEMPATADIAVIITSHNYGRYLAQCLRSVVSQTLRPREILVVDDASTDDTEEVVRGFREVCYYRVGFQNGNRARNFGFSKISSEWVVFFDADNYMDPRFLEVLYRALEADDPVDFVYCDRINFGEGDVSWYPEPMGRWRAKPFDADVLKASNCIDLASLLRARCFPGFDEALRRCQDWDLWLNIVLNRGGRGRYVAEPLFYYRVHGASLSRRENRDRAVWAIRLKYRLGPFFLLPLVRGSFTLYRFLQGLKRFFERVNPEENKNGGDVL